MKSLDIEKKSKTQTASKLAAAELLADTNRPLDQTELLCAEQSSELESTTQNNSEAKANESIQDDVLAVKNSLETGKLSKLLIEVRIIH